MNLEEHFEIIKLIILNLEGVATEEEVTQFNQMRVKDSCFLAKFEKVKEFRDLKKLIAILDNIDIEDRWIKFSVELFNTD
ncbi:hypothetical protein BCY89_27615 [Sphingobacterium siyangense]|uniref:Uncharacterized protein n=1 Tax=Sphingobacterium siyangense TaxID=459529 RepID=A0A420FXJ0_9SPHI|nr:hypothetical protein [Sphingobacterium siyangense]RKF37649.1 hypothetical protein BCY89_27615 [Sphingobacterium siyangense]